MRNFSRLERLAAACYFIWFFIHLFIFFTSQESTFNTEFWPFVSPGQNIFTTYDITEFLVYTGTPLVFFIAYRIFVGDPENVYYSRRHHSNSSFFIAFLDEKIKVEELNQEVNRLNNRPVDAGYLEELKSDRQKAGSTGVKDWINRVEVKKKYKDFEN